MYLIVGLGNPGKEYENTRHNVGFVVVDALQREFDFPAFRMQKKFNAETSKGRIGDHPVLLAKPQTFMNNSGASVGALKKFNTIPSNRCIVIYDDKDLPLGTIRLREKGGHGGHNGLRSILEHIKSKNVLRLRIGTAPTHTISDTTKFVLGSLSGTEQRVLASVIERVQEVIAIALTESLAKAIELANKKNHLCPAREAEL